VEVYAASSDIKEVVAAATGSDALLIAPHVAPTPAG
jgi:hypothetical protein